MINQRTLDHWSILRRDDMPEPMDPERIRLIPPARPIPPKYHYYHGVDEIDPVHDRILWYVARYGPLTMREIAQGLEMTLYAVRGKVGPLVRDRRLLKGPRRFCRVDGKRVTTYEKRSD